MSLTNVVLDIRERIDFLPTGKRKALLEECPIISHAQRGIWLKYKENSSENSYNLGFLIKLSSEVPFECVEKAVANTLVRHPILTVFFYEYFEDVHMIHLSNQVSSARIIEASSKDDVIKSVSHNYALPFDLERSVASFFVIYKTKEETFVNFLAHHILVDGLSLEIIKRTFHKYLVENTSTPESETEYFKSTKSFVLESEKNKSLDFWKKYYAGYKSHTIPWKTPEAPITNTTGVISAYLPLYTDFLFDRFNVANNYLPFSVLRLALSLTMIATKGLSNFFIGSTLLNRFSIEQFGSVGMYINTIKLKNIFNPSSTFSQNLADINQEMLHVIDNSGLTYLEIMEEIDDLDAINPFQIVLEYQRSDIYTCSQLFSEEVFVKNRTSKFDMALFVTKESVGHNVHIEFDTTIICQREAKYILDKYLEIIDLIVSGSEEINFAEVPPFEQALAIASNKIDSEIPSISKLIGNWALRTGIENVIIGPDKLSRDQFCGFVRAFSETFKKQKGDYIILWTNRRGMDLVMMVGAWAANKKFVAIDRNWPFRRLISLIEDIGTNVIFYPEDYTPCPGCFDPQILSLDNTQFFSFPVEFVTAQAGYLIYSSGTTGNPNGAIIGERSVLNLYNGLQNILKINNISKVAMNALFSFDASIQQLLQVFMGSSILILTEDQRLDIDLLVNLLRSNNIELIDCTPSFLKLLFQENFFKRLDCLKVVLVGGEILDKSLLLQIKDNPEIKFFNLYGPCECAVDTSFCEITPATSDGEIGVPLGNTIFAVVDENLNIMPKAQSGQLLICGESVGQGYINRKEFTKSKFINFNIGQNSPQAAYLTGDLGFISTDGKIFIEGRIDDQVKRNGVRIELSEIVFCAKLFIEVQDAVCYFSNEYQKIFLFALPFTVNIKILNEVLRDSLPSYMIPDAIIPVKKFLFNNSGKIDFKSMCEKAQNSELRTHNNEFEECSVRNTLQKIWSDNLKVNQVHEDSDFFGLGGNSLIAFKLLKDIRKEFDVKLSISNIFTTTKFSDLVDLIGKKVDQTSYKHLDAENLLIATLREKQNNSAPIFCTHAVGGSIASYFQLSSDIKYGGAIYGLVGFADENHKNMEEYAEVLVSHILGKNTENGVWLLGWSFGGILCLTIARALQKHGVRIKGVIIIDSFYNADAKEFENNFGLRSIIHAFLGGNGFIMDKELDEQVRQISLSDNLSTSLTKIRRFISNQYSIEFDLVDEEVKEIWRLANHHRQLANTFVPIKRSINAPVFVFQAEQSLSFVTNKTETLCSEGICTSRPIILPGDHYTVIFNPTLFRHIDEITAIENEV